MADIFGNLEEVVSDPLRFKAKLAIGEDAYTSLRMKNKIQQIWDTAGAAGTGMAVANSTVIASTFFAPQGILGLIGLGTAVTPIGWVAAAGILSGGAWYGVMHYLKNATNDRVTSIPKFINTPIDILAINLFDTIAPIALKIAIIDGEIHQEERKTIINYFINDWGYHDKFIEQGLVHIENNLNEMKLTEISNQLAKLQLDNPDCRYQTMSNDFFKLLEEVMTSDGVIDERESMAIFQIKSIFEQNEKEHSLLNQAIATTKGAIKSGTQSTICAMNAAGAGLASAKTKTAAFAESIFKLKNKDTSCA